jgi:hypothetical protein
MLAGKPQAPLLTRLDTFLRPKPLRYMVAQKESRLDLRRVMDEGKILLARLSQGAIGEENANLLGTLLVSKIHQLAMSRQELSAAERRPFYLYLDEFHNFVTPSMEGILSGARKYRLGLVLAHQDLRQISSRSPEVLSSVLTNPYARVCFRVGDQDARTLSEGFGHFDARDLQSLGIGEAIARVERAEYDFNLQTSPLPALEPEAGQHVREDIVARSRERYARPRSEIEKVLRGPGPEDQKAPLVVEPSTPSDVRRSAPEPERPTAGRPSVEPSTSVGPPTEATRGRGGPQHKYLQELIRQWAEANGWRVTLEEPILDDTGRVDVALRKGKRGIACEVAVSTTAQHEFQHVQKCLTAGFDRVLVVSPSKPLIRDLRRAIDSLSEPERRRVQCCSPEEMFEGLGDLSSRGQTSEQTVRGYRVKVRVSENPSRSPDAVRSTIASVLAKAFQRLKRKG